MIKQENNLWYVYNEEGDKKLSKGYETEAEAIERLKEIELFKTVDIDKIYEDEENIDAEYQGKEVTLNKPFRTPDDSKKFAVYVKNDEGNVVIVRFGDPDMAIKRDDPEARANFRARHDCKNKTDKTTAGYWSCKFWSSEPVSELLDSNILYVGMKDSATSFTSSIDERTGFMKVDAIIARTGIQKYLPVELGDEGNEPIGVLRSVEEVTHQDSLDSFVNVPITDNHPTEMVDIENYSKYAKGSISSVVVVQLDNGITALKTQSVITDKSLIESIRNGKKELSVGYENILVQKDGTHEGEDYKYIQTDIRANHVAVVDAGRCGGICKLMIDKSSMSDNLNQDEGETVMKIMINGVEFEVAEEVAAEIMRLQEALEAMKESEDEGTEEEKKEAMDRLQATVDTLTTSKVNLEKQLKDSQSLIDAGVEAKLAILDKAKTAGVEVAVTDSVLAIKQAIVKSLDGDIEGKSEVYLDAYIDANAKMLNDADERKRKALDSHKKVGDEYKPNKTIDYDAIANTEIN